ncbi:hypothetical protein [Mesomycoplasma ovipneumoniae]|uniref:hypothetical protein n=1 Tax=Mesomycoplasma ovipneumoniae TaxID=29562 RepID=UPI0026E23559|nr:hypothetical protein [Mesomycoplasma ovipneumoniae]MDO6829458.1 hypothetical protein [Mesomycoplasma ovipneumoniae]
MSKIIKLEIQNLTEQEKRDLFVDLFDWDGDTSFYEAKERVIYWNPNYKTFEDFVGEEYIADMDEEDLEEAKKEYEEFIEDDENKQFFFRSDYYPYYPENVAEVLGANDVDDALIYYFDSYNDEFIDFQKTHKNSLYNQALKQNNFKDLDYKDMVENLTQEQKDKIIKDISELAWLYESEDYIEDYAKKHDGEPYLEEITNEDRKIIEEFEKLKTNEEKEKFWEETNTDIQKKGGAYFYKEFFPINSPKEIENYKNSKYALVVPNEYEHEDWARLKFFTDQDELIFFGIENKSIGSGIVSRNEEVLNPNHKVNQWIVKNHELERLKKDSQEQKDSLEQTQKFEAPKLKMKM